jgi:hypothetical protein
MAVVQKFTIMSRSLHSTADLDNQYFATVDATNSRVPRFEAKCVSGTAFPLVSSILASVFLEVTLRRVEELTVQAQSPVSRKRGT